MVSRALFLCKEHQETGGGENYDAYMSWKTIDGNRAGHILQLKLICKI